MRKILHIYFIAALLTLSSAASFGQVRITEVMSSSAVAPTATPDWFEVTNLGNVAVDITGWKVDDNSFALATALALNGITSIPAGKSVIFIETATPETTIATFKTVWGSSVDNVSIGSYTGSGIGMSSGGDGTILFDGTGTEVTRVSFLSATAGSSFYWSYKADGTVVDNSVISTVGTINGTLSNQVTIKSTGAHDTASPGTAIVLPLNANTINPSMKPWRLEGRTLKFDVLPTAQVEVYSLTGLKVSSHDVAREIKLNLKQGIYVVKVDGKATKISLR